MSTDRVQPKQDCTTCGRFLDLLALHPDGDFEVSCEQCVPLTRRHVSLSELSEEHLACEEKAALDMLDEMEAREAAGAVIADSSYVERVLLAREERRIFGI